MNPALLNTAISAASLVKNNKSQTPTNLNQYDLEFARMREKRKQQTTKYVLTALSFGVLVFVGNRAIKKWKKDHTENDQSAAAQIAKQFDVAMHPANAGHWFPDGTNEKSIYNAAYRIVNEGIEFSKVATKYADISGGRKLMQDLRSELNNDEYAKLQRILSESYVPDNDPDNPNNPGYFKTIENGEFYKKADDYFGLKFNGGRLVVNAKLTGTKKAYTRLGVKAGDLLELRTDYGSTFWVKEHKIRKISPAEYRKLGATRAKKIIITKQ